MQLIHTGSHKIISVRRYLQHELTTLKKKTLASMADSIGFAAPANNKKAKLLEQILTKLTDVFNSERRSGISEEKTAENLLIKFKSLEPEAYGCLKRGLKSYCEWYRTMGLQSCSMYFPFKKPIGVTVENINCTSSCICQEDVLFKGNVITCVSCFRPFHLQCLRVPKNELFECPFCFLQGMDPLHEFVSFSFVGWLRMTDNIHNISFKVSDGQLASNKYQLEVRCIRLDGKNNYELTWPDYGCIKFNETKLLDFKPLVSNSSLKRRKDESKIIDRRLVRFDNSIQITVLPAQPKDQVRVAAANHLIAFTIVKINKPTQVFNNFKERFASPQQTAKMIATNLRPMEDVYLESVTISMKCVFSLQPIKIPARSKECTHLECFDLMSMITATTNSQPRRWRCPICKKKSHRMEVDPLFYKIIEEYKPKTISEVTFYQGQNQYKVTENENIESEQEKESSIEKKPALQYSMICISDESDGKGTEEDGKKRLSARKQSPTAPQQTAIEPQIEKPGQTEQNSFRLKLVEGGNQIPEIPEIPPSMTLNKPENSIPDSVAIAIGESNKPTIPQKQVEVPTGIPAPEILYPVGQPFPPETQQQKSAIEQIVALASKSQLTNVEQTLNSKPKLQIEKNNSTSLVVKPEVPSGPAGSLRNRNPAPGIKTSSWSDQTYPVQNKKTDQLTDIQRQLLYKKQKQESSRQLNSSYPVSSEYSAPVPFYPNVSNVVKQKDVSAPVPPPPPPITPSQHMHQQRYSFPESHDKKQGQKIYPFQIITPGGGSYHNNARYQPNSQYNQALMQGYDLSKAHPYLRNPATYPGMYPSTQRMPSHTSYGNHQMTASTHTNPQTHQSLVRNPIAGGYGGQYPTAGMPTHMPMPNMMDYPEYSSYLPPEYALSSIYGGVAGYSHHLRQSADANHQMYLNQARDYRMVHPSPQMPMNNVFTQSQTTQPFKAYPKIAPSQAQFLAQHGQKIPAVVPVKQKSSVIEIIDSDEQNQTHKIRRQQKEQQNLLAQVSKGMDIPCRTGETERNAFLNLVSKWKRFLSAD